MAGTSRGVKQRFVSTMEMRTGAMAEEENPGEAAAPDEWMPRSGTL
jgi:hypothetical protein